MDGIIQTRGYHIGGSSIIHICLYKITTNAYRAMDEAVVVHTVHRQRQQNEFALQQSLTLHRGTHASPQEDQNDAAAIAMQI